MVQRKQLSLDGQVLHAGILGFIHPKTEEYLEFSNPLPEDFQEVSRQRFEIIIDKVEE